MTDLAPTAANVKRISGPVKYGYAAVTIAPGQSIYKEAATGLYKLTDADSATAEARNCDGIALNAATADHPVMFLFAKDSVIALGAILTAGGSYIASDTAGGLMPDADKETGDYITQIGVAISTSQLKLNIFNSGAVV